MIKQKVIDYSLHQFKDDLFIKLDMNYLSIFLLKYIEFDHF